MNVLEAINEQGHGLRLTFSWTGDRYAQQVDYCGPLGTTPLLTSLEGNDQAVWPASPPLQQLTFEERPRGPIALLIGMAGSSHWSVSVETDTARAEIVFDVACRMSQQPLFLGSTYFTTHAVAGPQQQLVRLASGAILESLPVCEAKPNAIGAIEIADSDIKISAVSPESGGTPRWKYRLALELPS